MNGPTEMSAHPFLAQYLRIAYGCIACDGDIDTTEVSCLRSIAVQMGQPVAEVDSVLQSVRSELSDNPLTMVEETKSHLLEQGLTHEDASLLLDMLVQLVEADGSIRANESHYVRDLVHGLGLDRSRLREDHPEWREYLGADLRPAADARDSLSSAFARAVDNGSDITKRSAQ